MTAFGGSCYLNNAAVAVEALRASGVGRVAVIDIDAHHGNGTQALFYDRGDVFYGSVHVDPGAGWFPHYAGLRRRDRPRRRRGREPEHPARAGIRRRGWLAGVAEVCAAATAFRPEAVVVSLGVDAAADDPESPLQVTLDGYRRPVR